jgi:S-adenosylmethionine-diacylgycerolhomoserine-N-methlytransferase
MTITADARTLWRMLCGQPSGGSLRDRLEGFYAPQARRYDAFRDGLLHGRRELIARMRLQPGTNIVELGGGTGRNIDFLGDRLAELGRYDIVELAPSMAAQARERAAGHANVRVIEADAVRFTPAEAVDGVLFSYSLTMVPDWFRAVDNAISILKPGGVLGVVDFYVSRRNPPAGRVRHGAATRILWPLWFAHDGVYLSPDHLPYLQSRLPTVYCGERLGRVPYLPGVRAPWYLFVGRKAAAPAEP